MSVLLLNVTYEPIRIITERRAVCLVIQDKAEIVESKGTIRSASYSVPKPDVIKLKYYVHIPFKNRVPLTNKAVLNRDKFECMLGHNNKKKCLGKASTVDHVQPKSKGGKHEWTNVVAACTKCNSIKGSKTMSQLGWTLKRPAEPPNVKHWIMVNSYEKTQAWDAWLERS